MKMNRKLITLSSVTLSLLACYIFLIFIPTHPVVVASVITLLSVSILALLLLWMRQLERETMRTRSERERKETGL